MRGAGRTTAKLWPLALLPLAAVLILLFHSRSERRSPALLEYAGVATSLEKLSDDLVPAQRVEETPSESTRIIVRDELTRQPIPGARVEVRTPDEAQGSAKRQALADAGGEASFARLFPIGTRFDVSAEGYCPVAVQAEKMDAAPRREVLLARAGELRVRVLQEQGEPVPAAFVTAFPQDPTSSTPRIGTIPALWPQFSYRSPRVDGRRVQESVTDGSGEVLLHFLPCGHALVVTASESVPDTGALVEIPPASRSGEIEIRVVRNGCLRGRVAFADGSAPRGIFVRPLMGDSPENNRAFGCGPDGSFELCGLPLGWVRWRVEYPGEAERVDLLASRELDVGLVELPAPALLQGRVRVEDTGEDANYSSFILALYQGGKLLERERLPRDGRFSRRIPAGDATLELLRPEGLVLRRSVSVPCEPLDLSLEGRLARLVLRDPPFSPDASFNLWLRRVSRGCATPSETYYYSGHGTESSLAWRGRELELSLVLPGEYEVYSAGAHLDHLGRVVLTAGATSVLACKGGAGATLVGELRAGSGAAIPNGAVAARLCALDTFDPGAQRRATCDASGSFRFDDLCPGTWRVYPASLGQRSSAAVEVELAAGQQGSVQLRCDAPGEIGGRVTRAGVALAGTSVVLSPQGGDLGSSDRLRLKTDANGRYLFSGVFPGRYDVGVFAPLEGAESFRRKKRVDLAGEARAMVDFELEDPRTIVAVVRDGKPFDELSGAWAFTTRGESGAESVPTRRNALSLDIDRGPCLLILGSERLPRPDCSPRADCFYLAYEPDVANAAEIEVEIGGAEVVVALRDPSGVLPLARLTGIGPIAHPWGNGSEPVLAYEDVAVGVRRFPDVPMGSRLRLELPQGAAAGGVERAELTVDRALLRLEWPPRE